MGFDFDRLGRRIAEQRKHFMKVSQEKMAEDLGMYQADISNLEHARKGSGITDLTKLDMMADYFDIPLENLLFGSEMRKNMVPYAVKKLSFQQLPKNAKYPAGHAEKLKTIMGTEPENAVAERFKCGPYLIYLAAERQSMMNPEDFFLIKLHFYVFLGKEIIASMLVSNTEIGQYIHEPTFENLSMMIQPDVLDIKNILRILNPYYPLMMLDDNDIQDGFYKRMDELKELFEEPVFVAESIYVAEDCRQMGICRMLLDILNYIFGPHSIWLNMEPTAGDELDSEYGYFPAYSVSDVGQLNMNAAIAEKLGFTVDPFCCRREAETVDSEGNRSRDIIEIRKYAYKLSEGVEKIIADDGDLAAQSRAAQLMYETQQPDGIGDLSSKNINGKRVAELKYQSQDRKFYVFAYLDDDGVPVLNVARDSALLNSLNVELLESYKGLEAARNSEYYNEMLLAAMSL